MKIQAGDSIAIPEGFKAIVRGRRVVFEKAEEEVQEFKDGDILSSTDKYNSHCPFIYKKTDSKEFHHFYISIDILGDICFPNDMEIRRDDVTLRHATEEEKQLLFDTMKKKGLRWNTEERKVEKIRWRSEKCENYYFLNSDLSISIMGDTYSSMDDEFWDACNYFRTEKQAEEAAKHVREALQQYHEEIGE